MLPAELLFGRRLNSHLDNLKPSLGEKIQQNQKKTERRLYVHARAREFQVGDKVFVWNYRGRSIWLAGIVTGKEGRMVYVVQTQSGDSIRRHIDQMRVRVGESVNMGEDQDTEDTTNFRRDGDQDLTTYSQGLPSDDVAQNETEEEILPRSPEDPQNSENTYNTCQGTPKSRKYG